jgi:flagellar FliL protein
MAGENTEIKEETEQETIKKKLPLKLIIIVLMVVLLLGGAAAGYFLFLGPKMKSSDKASNTTQEPKHAQVKEHGAKKEAPAEGAIKQLDAFIVNLNDEQGDRYLKVVMQLEMNNTELEAEIMSKMPQIRDEILMLLSNKSFDDVATMAGKRMLKREIINGLNKYLTTGQVVQVYFSEFVVQ